MANSGSVCSHARIASANPCATKYCADSAAHAIMTAATKIAGPAHRIVQGPASRIPGSTNRNRRRKVTPVRWGNRPMVQRTYMPSFRVETPQRVYDAIVERGSAGRVAEFLPERCGRVFVVTTRDVWELHGSLLERALAAASYTVLFFPGGESRKRLAEVEDLAE